MGIDVMTLLLLWTAKDEWNYSYQDTKTDENTNDIVTTSFRGDLVVDYCISCVLQRIRGSDLKVDVREWIRQSYLNHLFYVYIYLNTVSY